MVVRALAVAMVTGFKHLFLRRITLRYPEQKLQFPEHGYEFDAKKQVGRPGFKGRHILFLNKCTGCQLCAIACDGIAVAIEMVTLSRLKYPQNKKSLWPQVDFGKCVFCGLCVDACPFDAFYMTNCYELSVYAKESLVFTPEQLALPPQVEGTHEVEIDRKGGAYHA